ncbi:MAG: LuxR C-terminal-related transcriptional regulator [Gaiellaceae bacterium]
MRELEDRTAVILDGHPLWVEALTRLLTELKVKVVGATASPVEALDLIAEHEPALFIAEYDALERSDEGLGLLRQAGSRDADLYSVVLATHDDPARIEDAFVAGASMYCVKTAATEDLASAIRQAFQRSIYHAGVRRRSEPTVIAVASEPAPALTKREIEILRLVAEGHSNSQLAQMLWVTEQTVKFHLSNIYRKLDVANRTEASRWAQRHGLLVETPAQSAA